MTHIPTTRYWFCSIVPKTIQSENFYSIVENPDTDKCASVIEANLSHRSKLNKRSIQLFYKPEIQLVFYLWSFYFLTFFC